jgi:prepilin-type N-terminal cleavage/methylation domain-containing protein
MHLRFRSGFTLIETVMAMAMISVALLALMSSILSTMQVLDASRQDADVLNEIRTKIAEIQATPFTTIYSTYTQPAYSTFSLTGYTYKGTPDVGLILFPRGANGTGNLNEQTPTNFTIPDATFTNGRPWTWNANLVAGNLDYNGNGSTGDTNCNLSYNVIPIKILVSWDAIPGRKDSGYTGQRMVEFDIVLTNYNN